jgi:hypothetical protein
MTFGTQAAPPIARDAPPLRIHPENPKLFEFRGRPLVLVTATEHYGAVMNRPFRFERYLPDAAKKGITLTRLFTLFRELQTPINPYSTCKPESPDYVAPYLRTGPGRALDGELKFDLDRPNPEFFDRLHRFVGMAAECGIVVEVVLFSNTYTEAVWALNPLHAQNNVNGMVAIEWPDYLSRRHPGLFARQVEHARRIVTELNAYDNVLYEICNEPGGRAEGREDRPPVAEVNAWLAALIEVVRATEAELPNRHLIAGQEAFCFEPWEQSSDLSFKTLDYDVVNIHPLPNTTYGGATYPLGDFMSKQLRLRALRDYCLATYAEPRPLNQDEDNIASQYKDVEGWTIHRKRAWISLLSGAHYDYIDFSIINYCETGTPESQRTIRTWMGNLARFMQSLDLIHARPLPDLLRGQPPHTVEAVFGVAGQDICIYLADARELSAARDLPAGVAGDPDAGRPLAGTVTLDLPAGSYQATIYDPSTGLYSPAIGFQAMTLYACNCRPLYTTS